MRNLRYPLRVSFLISAYWIVLLTISCSGSRLNKQKNAVVDGGILTANAWKVESVYGVLGEKTLGYTRGGSNNTESFDREYYVFNDDFTGYEVDNNGLKHLISKWELLQSPGRTTLKFVYHNDEKRNIKMTVIWDYLTLKNGVLHHDEYYFNPEIYSSFNGKVTRSNKPL